MDTCIILTESTGSAVLTELSATVAYSTRVRDSTPFHSSLCKSWVVPVRLVIAWWLVPGSKQNSDMGSVLNALNGGVPFTATTDARCGALCVAVLCVYGVSKCQERLSCCAPYAGTELQYHGPHGYQA